MLWALPVEASAETTSARLAMNITLRIVDSPSILLPTSAGFAGICVLCEKRFAQRTQRDRKEPRINLITRDLCRDRLGPGMNIRPAQRAVRPGRCKFECIRTRNDRRLKLAPMDRGLHR